MNLPKKCSDCRFYCGPVVEDSSPYKVSLGCNILLQLGEYVPAEVAKDEPPLSCPLAMYLRFRTLCEQCIVEDYGAESDFEEFSIRLPLFYNRCAATTLDYLGGRLGKNSGIETWLENKALFGRKPDTGYWHEVNLKTGEVVNAGHQHNPIKDMEARMSLAREKDSYTLLVDNPFEANKVEVWQSKTSKASFRLPDGVNVILVNGVTKAIEVYPSQFAGKLEKPWKKLFEVVVARGQVMSWTDFQSTNEPKPTTEERLDAIEKHLGLK